MRKCSAVCSCAGIGGFIAAAALSTAAHASLIGGAPTITPVNVATDSWSPGPSYLSLPSSGLSLSSATVGQGPPTAAGGTMAAMAETFTPGSSLTYGAPNAGGFTLGKIAVVASGGAGNNTVSMHLYAVTAAPSASASASYNDGAGGHLIGPDLLGGGAGLSFNWNPGALVRAEFNLDGTDNVVLQAGQTYALEFWTLNSVPNAFIWNRNGGSPADPGGQEFGARNADITDTTNGVRMTINQLGQAGGTPRIASLALYAVPEPTTLGVVGLAGLGLVARRRRV